MFEPINNATIAITAPQKIEIDFKFPVIFFKTINAIDGIHRKGYDFYLTDVPIILSLSVVDIARYKKYYNATICSPIRQLYFLRRMESQLYHLDRSKQFLGLVLRFTDP